MHVDRLLPKLDLDNASAQQLPFHPATALSLPRSSPFCHPERSRISCCTALIGDPGCGSLQREPHSPERSRKSRQEIRGSRADLRCAVRVPRSYRSTTSACRPPNPPGNFKPPFCYSGFPGAGRRTADPLGCAPPDFLLRLVALANFMRLSLRERRTRNLVHRSVAGNPGRDDKKESIAARKGRFLNRGILKI